MKQPTIYTIGHGTQARPITIIQTLAHHGIATIYDVRSTPYSRIAPQYNRDRLAAWLHKHTQIQYQWKGRVLGGVRCFSVMAAVGKDWGRAFEHLEKDRVYAAAIEKTATEATTRRICLLCAEHDPIECHRMLVLSRSLMDRGVIIQHLLHARGFLPASVESGLLAEDRLRAATGHGYPGLLDKELGIDKLRGRAYDTATRQKAQKIIENSSKERPERAEGGL